MKTVNLSEETNKKLDAITANKQKLRPDIVMTKKNVIADMVDKAYKRECKK